MCRARRLRAAAVVVAAAGCGAGAAPAAASYGWPVKPFDRPHPIRSTFGDPRTSFHGRPTPATLYRGSGSFSFHNGVDVAAPDGTAVYAVVSGTVASAAARKVIVRSGSGTTFQYWHIVPSVRAGQRVRAFVDVLGRIRRTYGHVHLVELRRFHAVNPLAPGHLTPYRDVTAPVIERVGFRRAGTTTPLLPELVRGAVEIVAPIRDTPEPAPPGEWAEMPVAPALVRWRVERAADHAVRVRERVAFDVRTTIPELRDFWRYYARGTRQNAPTFDRHRYWRQDGLLLYRLGRLDTRRLRDGIYQVVATAADARGNTTTARTTFLVYNHRRWPPPTRQA